MNPGCHCKGSSLSLTLLLALLLALGAWGCPDRDAQPPVHRPLPSKQIAEAPTGAPTGAAAAVLTRPALGLGLAPATAGAPTPAFGGAGGAGDGAWPFADPRPDDPAAARKRPMTIRDLYRVKNLSDPQISPDGRWVAFVQTTYDIDQGSRDTNLWLVGVDGKSLRQLTLSKSADYSPRWSPDGKQLLFVSTRGKGPQLYRLPLAGGEPEQLTTLSTGVADPVWSADGKRIVFRSKVFPEHGADDAKNKARLKRLRGGPVHAVMANDLLFRHWTSYDDGRRHHVLALEVATKKITDLTPGPHHAPPLSLHGHRDFALSPDGEELCYQSNYDPPATRASSTNNDLFVVSTTPGAGAGAAATIPGPGPGPRPVNLTATNKAWDGSCAYSPDGRYIAYRMHRRPGYESDRVRLALLERKTGKVRVLTPRFDYWVDHFHWLPDSRGILFSAPVRGRWPLFTVDITSGKITRLPAPPSVRHFSLSPDGRLIALVHTTVARPPELYVVSVDGTTPRQLTEINKQLAAEVDFRPAEELWLPGDGGKKIHTFVVKPHGFKPGNRYPLILNVHGGPQYQWSDAFRGDWQVYPAAGYVVAFPNTAGSIGYGQRFTEAISKDWGGRVFRDTMAVADALAKLPYVDGQRMGVMGWSYGGYLVNWIGGQTRRFKALASMMGVYDLATFFATTEEQWFPEWDLGGQPWTPKVYAKFSPSKFVTRYKTPTLILSGQLDFRIPYTQSIALFTALRKRGVPARLVLFENDGHWPDYVRSMPVYYNAHLEWFHQYLKGGPAPWKTADMVRNRAYGKSNKSKAARRSSGRHPRP
jgi:dipeptidyl aminopeptidase/acylaminoacyl peptidase